MSWGNQIFGVMAACFIGAANPAAVDATDVDVKVSLQDAIRQGSVEVNVTHLGGSTGDNVRVSVRRRGQRAVEVDVAAGTVLRSSTVRYQHIACGKIKGEFTQGLKYRPGSTMVLVDTDWHHFLLEGYCLDYHKKAPPRGQGYAMALHDHRAARILNAAPVIKASPWAFQLALWMDREGLPAAEIQRRFPGKITEVDVSVAQTLLRHAEQSGKKQIPQDMAPDVQQQVEKLFATDPQVRDAAVKVLVGMGGRAAAAMPYVAVNVVTQQNPGEWALGALPPIPTTPAEAAELLERVGVPGLQP